MSKRKPTKILPPVEYLRECFTYDPGTGEMRWKFRPKEHFVDARVWASWNARFANTTSSSRDKKGYFAVALDYITYRAHRLIWKIITAEDPPNTIDHIDGDPSNNRFDNLRVANGSQQKWNKGLGKRNTSGHRGVNWSRGKWVAQIKIHRVQRYLGRFDTAEGASLAYEKAARELHGEFYREHSK